MKKRLLLAAGVLTLIVAGGAVWQLQAAPTIGAVAANPAYVVVNTPTEVVFTANIPDTSVIPAGVNLLQVDANGKTLRTVGAMRDDGMSGDVKATDKVFSLRMVVNRSTVGTERYRVSAAFRGVLQRVQSPTFTVTVDPFHLPPDPGEAGRQTLDGVDVNKNGIRDDVERHIGLTYSQSEPTRRALFQFAEPFSLFLHDGGDRQSARDHSASFFKAWNCLLSIRPSDADALISETQAVFLNTSDRVFAYDAASKQLHGTALPELFTAGNATMCE